MKEYLFWDDEILIESINADIICLYVFKGKEVLEFPQFYPQTSDFAPLIINNFMKMPKI